ncbi:MAG: sulfatase-like hydrolase/transferase, partial [Chloroflexi bacterium]|nr:sulfatase-like hydrolase/transferase [Chloroflexota bacterium]
MSQPRNPERVNVILLSIDTLRADHLTSYGYRHDTAPFLEERFGRGGTVFDHMVASATITTPSHASMFTALSPPAHGAVHGVKILPRRIPTLAEIVRRKGIDTAAFTEDGWLGVQHGFGRGFADYESAMSTELLMQNVTYSNDGREQRGLPFLTPTQVAAMNAWVPISPPQLEIPVRAGSVRHSACCIPSFSRAVAS